MKRAIALFVAASAGTASAEHVTINFEDQFPNPFNRPSVLDDELSGAPYYIEFGGDPDLVGFGDVEVDA